MATISTDNYTLGMCDIYFAATLNHPNLKVASFNTATNTLGNIVTAEFASDVSYIEHYISDRGSRKRDKVVLNMVNVSIPFTFDEINESTLKRYFMASELTQGYLALYEQPLLEGCAKLKFDTDIGGSFEIIIPRCTIKPDGNLSMNVEDWWSGPMSLDILYFDSTATPWDNAPYGICKLT